MDDLNNPSLSVAERTALLQVARETLTHAVKGEQLPPLDLAAYPPRLREPRATFVTLTLDDQLRGCVGAIEPRRPLVEDVRENTIAAAFYDPRFPPVSVDELEGIAIELSILSPLKPLAYEKPHDLLETLRPNIDGVLIRYGDLRATFLPKVWEKIPDPVTFLDHLCFKMGVSPDFWRTNHLEVFTYQTETFQEPR